MPGFFNRLEQHLFIHRLLQEGDRTTLELPGPGPPSSEAGPQRTPPDFLRQSAKNSTFLKPINHLGQKDSRLIKHGVGAKPGSG